MHLDNMIRWQHSHRFAEENGRSERRTHTVIALTASIMVIEITAGIWFNSMALLADGWHMSTHVAALVITAVAYALSRRHADNPRFSFGTGKMGVLGGFASSVVLAVVALIMASESIHRFFQPLSIHFNQAIGVAVVGLLVNVICALLLKDDHHHGHSHHGHDRHVGHGADLNLRSAYVHVLADALTSVTAIGALLAGKFFGWGWMDPIMGVVGSVVIAVWAAGLIRDTSGILLDQTPKDTDLPDVIPAAIEADGDARIADLHVWQVSSGKFAAIVSIVAHEPQSAEYYRGLLSEHEELVHATIEVHTCEDVESSTACCRSQDFSGQ